MAGIWSAWASLSSGSVLPLVLDILGILLRSKVTSFGRVKPLLTKTSRTHIVTVRQTSGLKKTLWRQIKWGLIWACFASIPILTLLPLDFGLNSGHLPNLLRNLHDSNYLRDLYKNSKSFTINLAWNFIALDWSKIKKLIDYAPINIQCLENKKCMSQVWELKLFK